MGNNAYLLLIKRPFSIEDFSHFSNENVFGKSTSHILKKNLTVGIVWTNIKDAEHYFGKNATALENRLKSKLSFAQRVFSVIHFARMGVKESPIPK